MTQNLSDEPLDSRSATGSRLRKASVAASACERLARQPSEGGRVDRAGDRPSLLDQRDIDRELAVAGDEFLRPVERIDQQESLPAGDGLALRRRFFRDDRYLRDGAGEVLADDGLRALVGERDRAAVVLGANAAVLRVDLHHRGPRGQRGLGEEKGDLLRRCGNKIERARRGAQRNSRSEKAVSART